MARTESKLKSPAKTAKDGKEATTTEPKKAAKAEGKPDKKAPAADKGEKVDAKAEGKPERGDKKAAAPVLKKPAPKARKEYDPDDDEPREREPEMERD